MVELAASAPSVDELEELEDVRRYTISAHWLYAEDQRLDATNYASGAFVALDAVARAPVSKSALGTLCGTIWHPVQTQARSNFKRIYTSPEFGVPFVSSREMFSLPLRPDRFLSRKMPKLRDLMVPEGWLVVSRSGTVGNVLYMYRSLAACAVSDHAIRVEPKAVESGYLYAFLASSYGQALIAKGVYGGTVDEIEPKHLASIPVPMAKRAVREAIHERIMTAYRLRNEANVLLGKADAQIHELLGVSPFSATDIDYLGGVHEPRSFAVSSSELADRLDATNHLPIVRSAIRKLQRGRFPLVSLDSTGTTVRRPGRFKRIYVKKEQGVPFLQPSHINLFRVLQFQYLSPRANAKVLQECMLKEGSVLVTRSGTAAETAFVTRRMEQWAGSDDLIRVEPGSKFDGGFLAAYFATPYAKHQMLKELYGGVVDHIDEPHVRTVLSPDVPRDLQTPISDLVRTAYRERDAANDLEDEAIAEIEGVVLGLDDEQLEDARIARRRLAEVQEDPGRLISGAELARRLEQRQS
jgi:type I restriction enzyme S subunit